MPQLVLFLFFFLHAALLSAQPHVPSTLSPQSVDLITGEYVEKGGSIAIGGPMPVVIERQFQTSSNHAGEFSPGWHFEAKSVLSNNPDEPEAGKLRLLSVYDTEGHLTSVKVVNDRASQVYAWAYFTYSKTACEVETHQGLHWTLTLDAAGRLEKVGTPDQQDYLYQYVQHPITKQPLIRQVDQPDGHFLINEYYTDAKEGPLGRVKLQQAPIGYDATPVVVARYEYSEGSTTVFDALDRKTVYHHDGSNIRATESFGTDGQLYHTELFFYQSHPDPESDQSLLVSRSLQAADGSIFSCTTYAYDDHGLLVKETLYGDLTGKGKRSIVLQSNGIPAENGVEAYHTFYTYSSDQRHVLLKKQEDNGHAVRYIYGPRNDLIIAKLVYDGSQIAMRYGYKYDQNGILICTVVDDGQSEEMSDTTGVTERYVKETTLSEEETSRGLPLLLEEKAYDVKSQKEATLKTTIYSYSSKGLCTQQEVCGSDGSCLDAYLMDYDEAGRLAFLQNGKGEETFVSYDARGNKTRVIRASDEADYVYDFSNRIVRETHRIPDGKKTSTSYTYDLSGHKIASTDSYGHETRFSYDALGRLSQIVYPAAIDREERVIHPEIKQVYDAAGCVISTTDENGYVTSFAYNSRGNPVEILYPDSTREAFTYDVDGSLKAQTSKTGLRVVFTRDFLGRPLKADYVTSDGKTVRSVSATYTSFQMTSQTDANGNLVVKDAPPTVPVAAPQTSADGPQMAPIASSAALSTSFDDEHFVNERGQTVLQKAQIDAAGNITLSTFDALGRVEEILFKDGMGTILSERHLRYDAMGNKVLQKDIYGSGEGSSKTAITSWIYGPSNRLESYTEFLDSPHQRTTTYSYNGQGLLEKIVKADGVALQYEYDELGQMVRFFASDASFAYAYSYDPNGNILEVQDLTQQTRSKRQYNAQNRVTMEVLANGLQVGHDYDALGQLTKLILPDGSAVEYAYEGFRLKYIHRLSVSQQIRYTHSYSYDAAGKLASSHLPGSLGDLSYSWNATGRCLGIYSPYWSEILDEDSYDPKGNIQRLVVQDLADVYEETFAYDEQGQLIEESGAVSATYSYDRLYNRLNKNETTYAVNDCYQVTEADDSIYTYDPNGNLVAKQDAQNTVQYRYDALNRLVAVTKEKVFSAAYTYDAFNRRLTQRMMHWDAAQSRWTLFKERRFIYDEDREIGATDEKGRIVELRVLGLGHGAEIGAAVAIELNQKTYVPIHDHRGSVRCLVNMDTGLPEEFYRYSAFGETFTFDAKGKSLAESAVQNPWGYSSKRLETESGLIFYGRRDYDPELGRWTTPDPLGFVDTPNRYAYLGNNPVSHLDLYGLFSFDLSWESFYTTALSWLQAFREQANLYHTDRENYPFFTELERNIEEYGQLFMGPVLFRISGYYFNPSRSSVYGGGEKYEKVRVTFINGILNNPSEFERTLELISVAHGGTNVHYTYRGTQGWTVDMIHCMMVKFGYVSENACQLAQAWKRLIQEMGGTEGGGVIIHYAHSIGGTETLCAKGLMTPEELKMIRVITFGSPTVIPNGGFRDVVNYSNRRDGVSGMVPFLPNPMGHLYYLLYGDYNLILTGSHFDGFPIVDHLFDSYWNYWLNHANGDMPGALP